MLGVAGVGLPVAGGAVAKDQDVGVRFAAFALAAGALPPHRGLRGPAVPGAGQHQILFIVRHVGQTHRLCRGDVWRKEGRG